MKASDRTCPECGLESRGKALKSFVRPGLSRRDFLGKIGWTAAGLAAMPLVSRVVPAFPRGSAAPAEKMLEMLHASLTAEQKKILLLPWSSSRRLQVANNWRVVPQRINRIYSNEQQEMIRKILQNVTSEEGYDKIIRAMRDDAGGLGNYSACLFSDGQNKLAFVLTGRHQTIRAGGEAGQNSVFGGPLFYGHAVDFNERPDHPGNVWWHQARLASKVYQALDGRQQRLALVERDSPADQPSSVRLQGDNGRFSGIPVSELSSDQRELVESVLQSLLEPYRESDVVEVMSALKANGGLDKLHISFYKDGDLPDKDGIWDRWKLEGPAFVWYFRGSPHVHTWIHVAHKAQWSA